jgi:hypothetical protein
MNMEKRKGGSALTVGHFMPSSTITFVVPRCEDESLFLRHVVQAAIRAYRKSDDTKQVYRIQNTPREKQSIRLVP